jgi:putative aminopeptidase FrvX
MPVSALTDALPELHNALADQPAVNYLDPLWEMLRRLLLAHAPSGGANLLGGIGDDIAVLADELGLRDRVKPYLGSTGNTAIWLGADKPDADLVVVAHMDRPSFRVRSVDEGTLYAICANRFPPGEYRITAKAVRFDRGRLIVGAEGVLVSHKADGQETLHFEAKHGHLTWQDIVLVAVNPVFDGERVVGTGLDNCLGLLTTLLTAAVLRAVEDALRQQERRCLFVFTDQEEGPPDGFFGHGAARLTYELRPPTYGCVIADAHTAGPGLEPQLGGGISHATASRWGSGSIVPPNYHALAIDLAGELNAIRPGTVQLNNGYLSRSDDLILGRWTRVLGLAGPPMTDPHTGQEAAHLGDIQDGVWWLAHFLAATLNLSPDLRPRYALGR